MFLQKVFNNSWVWELCKMPELVKIRKRDGTYEFFEVSKIESAIRKAILDVRGEKEGLKAKALTKKVTDFLEKNQLKGTTLTVKDVEDVIFDTLKENKLNDVIESYKKFQKEQRGLTAFRTFMNIRDDIGLTSNALKVLAKRYLLKDENGNVVETPKRLFERVAKAIAFVDTKYSKGDVKKTTKAFTDLLTNLEFLPNTPTLMNAGTELGQLSACFVLPIEDSLESIFTTLKHTALIQQCLVPETFVMNENGLSRLDSIREGSIVTSDDGLYTVSNVWKNGKQKVFEVKTKHGYSITGTNEHKLVIVNNQGDFEWRRIGELKKGDWTVLNVGDWLGKNNELPKFVFKQKKGKNKTSFKANIFRLPKELSSELAELIGFYIGDGSNHRDGIRVTVSEKDKDSIERIKFLCKKVFNRLPNVCFEKNKSTYEVSFLSVQVKAWFDFLGFTKKSALHAFIPEVILKSSEEIVASFFRGLYTTDGCINNKGYISFSSISSKLIETAQITLLHMGIPTRIYFQNRLYNCRPAPIYHLAICTKKGLVNFKQKIGFSCSRKQERLNKLNPEKIFVRNEIIPNQVTKVKEWYKTLPYGEKSNVQSSFDRVVNRTDSGQLTVQRINYAISKISKQLIPDYFHQMTLNKFYTQITQIKEAGEREVLDLTIPKKNSYIANGFISHNSGGGTGFNFSKLRPKGDLVKSTKGVASGPISFMKIYNQTTEEIKQGGKRRGANMGLLSVYHPDIEQFISLKSKEGVMNNFNLSVLINDEFFERLKNDKHIFLLNPRTGKQVRPVKASQVFDLIAENAWRTGDPGLVFIDEVNKNNPTPSLGKLEATNPCGEMPLLSYESCNLGSINLVKMFNKNKFSWEKLKKTIKTSIHFLDNVIDANKYVVPEVEQITKANRKIGLGVMGFAEALINQNIPYNSKEALNFAEKLMKFIQKEAKEKSEELGKERGNFPNFEKSSLAKQYKNMRNATVTTIAPTGTISLIAGVSSGIEPLFAVSFIREVMEGTKLLETNELFEEAAREKDFYSKKLMQEITRKGSIQNIAGIPKNIKSVFATSMDITPDWHVKMQAAFQKYTDNGVSKTINLPSTATIEDVKNAYLLSYSLKCKGITVFRYGSKKQQVLFFSEDEKYLSAKQDFAGGCPGLECVI